MRDPSGGTTTLVDVGRVARTWSRSRIVACYRAVRHHDLAPDRTSNLLDAQNGPMANLGRVRQGLQRVPHLRGQIGAKGQFTSPLSSRVCIQGTTIGMDVRGYGDFTTYENGAEVPRDDGHRDRPEVRPASRAIVPIAKLPQVAEEAQTVGGCADLQADGLPAGSLAEPGGHRRERRRRPSAYGVTGAGQKVGVLSDSVNAITAGVSPPRSRPATCRTMSRSSRTTRRTAATDEGRAMLEQIHDLAPGASLAFATGDIGEASFGSEHPGPV